MTMKHASIAVVLLASFVPGTGALAMNDPVTGRWMTRDPLSYNPPLLAIDTRYLRRHPRPEVHSLAIVSAVPDSRLEPHYEYLYTSPMTNTDASGLIGQCPCPCPTLTPAQNPQGCPESRPGLYGPECTYLSEVVGDGHCNEGGNPFHIPPATTCYRGYGAYCRQQCCYDVCNCLITKGRGAGSRDTCCVALGDTRSGGCQWDIAGLECHLIFDVIPWIIRATTGDVAGDNWRSIIGRLQRRP